MSLEVKDTPVTLIEDHFFLGVNKTLQELNLINTALEEYPIKSLQVRELSQNRKFGGYLIINTWWVSLHQRFRHRQLFLTLITAGQYLQNKFPI